MVTLSKEFLDWALHQTGRDVIWDDLIEDLRSEMHRLDGDVSRMSFIFDQQACLEAKEAMQEMRAAYDSD